MSNRMTTAEYRGYQQICGTNGRMMVVACDQRGAMRKILAATPEEQAKIDERKLGDVKSDIVAYLANAASCVLLDPVCAVPRVVDEGVLGRDTALLIGLDASGWDTDPSGYRLSRLVPGIDARRVRELGGTGGKLMVYLRPDRPAANTHNIQLIRDCVADFAKEDLLLVVEILTYAFEGEDEAEYKANFGRLIEGCARIAIDEGAKVLKLPFPGSAASCRVISEIARDVPWAVLSAGVDHETFLGQVKVAMENGASGVIAGRSLWKDCISIDREEEQRRLANVATPRLRQLQAILDGFAVRVPEPA
ncbi:tagatose-bisphosphate aldolase [Pleomorphomonas carboxyditropha]|uniref:Tagatose-bisphosphate aldolase n=1 Tax=Pleomorphomonas carboxyditropha TaxID=2023338 RepID=A0A2G9X035_9HYPH|nr:tagatose-bisphosphate aldolase [Pleomorphomonas carboxyditropha]PIP00328.1 tagatose-bisphosphate aldolase [Pleomorphomonas carboxyditropha]